MCRGRRARGPAGRRGSGHVHSGPRTSPERGAPLAPAVPARRAPRRSCGAPTSSRPGWRRSAPGCSPDHRGRPGWRRPGRAPARRRPAGCAKRGRREGAADRAERRRRPRTHVQVSAALEQADEHGFGARVTDLAEHAHRGDGGLVGAFLAGAGVGGDLDEGRHRRGSHLDEVGATVVAVQREESARALARASTAAGSPIAARLRAAIMRTSSLSSLMSSTSAATAASDLMRPSRLAEAARRQRLRARSPSTASHVALLFR